MCLRQIIHQLLGNRARYGFAPARGDRSRESPTMPTSFSTWTIIDAMRADPLPAVRASAPRTRGHRLRTFVLAQRGEHLERLAVANLDPRDSASGPAFTQTGAKARNPCSSSFRTTDPARCADVLPWASASAASTKRKSYFPGFRLDPVPGNPRQHRVQVRFARASGHTDFMILAVRRRGVVPARPPAPGTACRPRSVGWRCPRVSPGGRWGAAGFAGGVCANKTEAAKAKPAVRIMFFIMDSSDERLASHCKVSHISRKSGRRRVALVAREPERWQLSFGVE